MKHDLLSPAGRKHLLMCFIITIATANAEAGNFIEFFNLPDLEGPFFKTTLNLTKNGTCVNIPSYGHAKASSVKKPQDSCVMLYQLENCQGLSFRLYSKGNYNDLGDFDKMAKSFQPCNKEQGGLQINVDFYEDYIPKRMILSWKNLCACRRLPTYATPKVWALHNHGNCVKVFQGPKCTGPSVRLRAGRSEKSDKLKNVGFHYKIQSISPCDGHPPCTKITAELTNFEILPDAEAVSDLSKTKNLRMGGSSKLRNDGGATITEEYNAAKKITETIEVTRVSTAMYKFSSHVSSTIKAEGKASVPLVAEGKVSTELTVALGFGTEHGSSEGTTTKSENMREFAISKRFEIPPCSEYTISSYIEFVNNYHLKFVAWSHVTGEINGRQMNWQEVKERLGGLTFVKSLNETMLLAKETGFIKLNYGVDSKTTADGKRIPGCKF